MQSLFLAALILWLAGYFSTKGLVFNKSITSPGQTKLIVPPRWMYYLCGAPKSTKYAVGTMTSVAFRAQMAGVILGIYTCIILWKPSQSLFLIGLGTSVALPYMITFFVERYYKVK
jgi:hypothetical protein